MSFKMDCIEGNFEVLSYIRLRAHGYSNMLTFFINNAFIAGNLTYRNPGASIVNGVECPPLKINNYLQLVGLDDTDFWSVMHISREIIWKIIKFAEHSADELRCADIKEIKKIVPMCIWYLANKDCTVEDVTKFFNLGSVLLAEAFLSEGFTFLSRLKDYAIMCPDLNDHLKSKKHIKHFYHLKNVVGYIGNLKLTTQLGKKFLVQVLMDADCNFYAYDISFNLNIVSAFKKSQSLKNAMKSLPKNSYIAGDLEYSAFEKLPIDILAPPENTVGNSDNGFDEYTFSLLPIRYTLSQLQMRFPKIKKLDTFMPEAIVSALVLQNICTMSNDLPPRRIGNLIDDEP